MTADDLKICVEEKITYIALKFQFLPESGEIRGTPVHLARPLAIIIYNHRMWLDSMSFLGAFGVDAKRAHSVL